MKEAENVFLTHIWGCGCKCAGGIGHMAYEISHFFCSSFVVNPSILSWERISQGRLELFGIWNLIIRVSMVDQRIVLLDPLELWAPCTIVLWVLLVE